MHNGVALNPNAIEAVEQLKKHTKKIVFLSNAPRPSSNVINFLLKMKMDKNFSQMSLPQVGSYAHNKNQFGQTFYHLGPPRDTSVFEKVKDNRTNLEKCDFILCTGLFDDYENDLEYYKNF